MPIPTPGWPEFIGTIAEAHAEYKRRQAEEEWGTYRSPVPVAHGPGMMRIPPWPPADAVLVGATAGYVEYTDEEQAERLARLQANYHAKRAAEQRQGKGPGGRVSAPRAEAAPTAARAPERPPAGTVAPEWASDPNHPWVKKKRKTKGQADPGPRLF